MTADSSSAELRSLSADAPDDIWSVGIGPGGTGGYSTLVEHWDGTSWTVVPSPDPGFYSTLFGVVAESPTDVWTGGYQEPEGTGPSTGLMLHWDGSRWTRATVHDPNWKKSGVVYAMGASSATDIWGVGEYTQQDPAATEPLVEHWDGTSWSSVATPAIGGGGYLHSVSADSPTDAWAVGDVWQTEATFLEHWDGHTWSDVSSLTAKSLYVAGVDAVSPSSVFAVGTTGPNERSSSFVEYWNGTTWTRLQ